MPLAGKGLQCFLSQQKPFREVLPVQANPSEKAGFEVRDRDTDKKKLPERKAEQTEWWNSIL
jgi:hypothetical protein